MQGVGHRGVPYENKAIYGLDAGPRVTDQCLSLQNGPAEDT